MSVADRYVHPEISTQQALIQPEHGYGVPFVGNRNTVDDNRIRPTGTDKIGVEWNANAFQTVLGTYLRREEAKCIDSCFVHCIAAPVLAFFCH